MTVPKILQLPDHPNRADAPPDFSQKADAWVAAMQPMTEQINVCVAFSNDRAVDADAGAQAAASSAAEAATILQDVINNRDLAEQAASAAGGFSSAAEGSAAAASSSESNAAASASAAEVSATEAAESERGAIEAEQNSKQSELLALAAKDAAEAAAGGKFLPDSATYTYENERIIKITENDVFDTVIDYNPDNTVHSIEYPGGRIETFTYDNLGNVVSMTATGGEV